MKYLEEIFYEGIKENTLNDFLWFERDEIFEQLEIEN